MEPKENPAAPAKDATSTDLKCRLATREDYQAVININKEVYEGFDYLPQLYHVFADDPNHLQFVAECNGKIISYYGAYVIENHTVYLSVGARTDPSYQKRGISYKLDKFKNKYLAEKFRGKRLTERWAAVNRIATEEKVKANRAQKLLMYWNHVAYEVQASGFHAKSKKLLEAAQEQQPKRFLLTQKLSIKKARQLLKETGNLQQLHKFGGYIICGGPRFPFKVTIDNMISMVRDYRTMFSFEEEHSDGNACFNGVSTSCSYRTLDGSLKLDIFYHGEPNLQTWIPHFLKHLMEILETDNVAFKELETLKIIIHFPDKMSVRSVEDFVRPVLGNRVSVGEFAETRSFVAEQYPMATSRI